MLGENYNSDQIAGAFANWLATVSTRAAEMLIKGKSDDQTSSASGRGANAANSRNSNNSQSTNDRVLAPVDTVPNYSQSFLDDGRVLKQYDDGSVRLENPRSGVIQEERANGSLLVSLPDGKLLFQEFPSDPLLVYDLNHQEAPPRLAGVGMVALPGESDAKPVYNFRDDSGTHLVDIQSLRYFRVRNNAGVNFGGQMTSALGRAS